MYFRKKYYRIVIILILLGLPNILLIGIKLFNGHFFETLRACYSLLVTTSLFLLIPVIFNVNFKRFYYTLLPLTLLIPIIAYVILLYHKTPTRWMLYAVFNANKTEVLEFVRGLWFWKVLILFFPLIVLFHVRKLDLKNLNINGKNKTTFICAIFFLVLISYVYKAAQSQSVVVSPKVVFRTIFKDTPVYTVIRTVKALDKKHIIYTEQVAPIVAIADTTITDRQVYVIVLGESSRYENWQINGYQHATSPYLMDVNNLVGYSDVISPSFLTDVSVPLMFSNLELSDNILNDTAISLINVFNTAGFDTYWITNQRYSNNNTAIIAQQSDKFVQLDCKSRMCYDSRLLAELQEIMQGSVKKLLIVLHLKGNHYPYQNTYPDEFDFFSPSLKRNSHLLQTGKNKKEIVNTYNNSILYTSYILSNCIEMVDNIQAYSAVLFVSDHGECLFDNGNRGFGRGFNMFTPEVFHIPLFIWTSEAYRDKNINLTERINSNKDYPFSSAYLFETIMELSNIQSNIPDLDKSIFRDNPGEQTRYVQFNNKVVKYN